MALTHPEDTISQQIDKIDKDISFAEIQIALYRRQNKIILLKQAQKKRFDRLEELSLLLHSQPFVAVLAAYMKGFPIAGTPNFVKELTRVSELEPEHLATLSPNETDVYAHLSNLRTIWLNNGPK